MHPGQSCAHGKAHPTDVITQIIIPDPAAWVDCILVFETKLSQIASVTH